MCNLKKKIEDIRVDDIFKRANTLLLNETYLSGHDHLSVDMLMLPDDILIVRSDHNNLGGSVVLLIDNHLNPQKLTINSTCVEGCSYNLSPFSIGNSISILLTYHACGQLHCVDVENNFTI